jgi:hypothetical protein
VGTRTSCASMATVMLGLLLVVEQELLCRAVALASGTP